MLEVIILFLSVVAQLGAAILALTLIRLTNHKSAWVTVSLALLLMTVRRLIPLLFPESSLLNTWIFDITGLLVSVFMLVAIAYIRHYFTDIFTAERILRESEQRYRMLAQNIPDGAVFLYGRNGRYTLAEGPLLQKFGVSSGKLVGAVLDQVPVLKSCSSSLLPMYAAALEGTAASTQQACGKNTFSIQTIPLKNADQDVIGGMALITDITTAAQAEKARSEAYDTLQRTIDGVSEPIMVIGLDYRVNLMNRVVREGFVDPDANPTPACYMLSHHRDAPCNDPSHPCPLNHVKDTRKAVMVLHSHQTVDGQTRLVEIHASPLFNQDGQLVGVIEASHDITENQRAEQALRESEERFSRLAAFTYEGIAITRAGKIVDANPQLARMLGYTVSELIGKETTDFLEPKYRKRININVGINSAEVHEYNLQTKRGLFFPAEIRTRSIHYQGHAARVIAVRDLSERKQTQAHLQRLAEMVDMAPSSITVHTIKGKFVYANQKTFQIHGYDEKEFMALNLHELDVPESEKLIADRMKQIAENGEASFEVAHYRKDRSTIPLSIYVKAIEWMGEPAMLSIATDITEHNRAEEQSRHHTEELEVLARVSSAMRTAENLSELFPVLLKQVAELLHADGAFIILRDAKTEETVSEYGYGLWKGWQGMRLPPGKGIGGYVLETRKPYLSTDILNDPHVARPEMFTGILSVACVPLVANQNALGALMMGSRQQIPEHYLRLLTSIGDMAANAIQRQLLYEDLQTRLKDLREAQARLVQSEKMAAIGELISGVAHELNNPLTSVVLYSQLMQQDEFLPEKTRSNLDKVVAEALRAGRIVHGLLDFARQRPINHQSTQVNVVIKESLDLIAYELHANGITAELDLSPKLPVIMADPHRLNQVFVNLIQNAWQAISSSRNKGSIKISTTLGNSIYNAAEKNRRKMVRVCIQDNGSGIPEDIITRIFDPFFTTKPEGTGTGLGLSICHGIIAEHGGHIWAESEPGKGASFFIELPATPARPAKSRERTAHSGTSKSPKKMRVLILDDETNVRDVLGQALIRRGYSVDTADNGGDGLAFLAKNKYDSILCDVRMPGFNGVDFYRQIKSSHPELAKKVIFITGDTANKMTYNFIEENKVQYLSKPFELSDLLQVILLVGGNERGN